MEKESGGMQQLQILVKALEYIEDHLFDVLRTEEIAEYCYCSKSSLEKIFRCFNRISVHEYIVRRKMSLAGKMLMERPERTILDVAVAFGFSSNEAFTRAFRQVWNVTPSVFRKNSTVGEMCHATILFPQYIGYTEIKMESKIESGDDRMRKNVDISELYDLFIARRDCYFVCSDIQGLISYNEISRKAGDLAILEALRRMEAAAGEEDYVFRIGADEFVVMTNTRDLDYANAIAKKVADCNGDTFTYKDRELKLGLYVSVMKLNGDEMRYNDLFDTLHQQILESKFEE